jgi:hypothetical protein
MGNLIIKGKGGAGNKLILQDQAGAAVLTTADSGATIASGVTGGAGLSGMTSLGTVTAGNLSNSAIVYPAGHVIKQQNFPKTSDSSSSSTSYVTAHSWTYTPHGGSANNSTIYAVFYILGEIPNSAHGEGRMHGKWLISGSDITNLDYTLVEAMGSYDHGSSGVRTYGAKVMAAKPVTLDGTGNAAISYTFQLGTQTTSSGWFVRGDASVYESFAVVTEVQ